MSSAATLSGAVAVSNGGASGGANSSFAPTLAGAHFIDNIQSAGTGAAVIAIGSVVTLGYLYVRNLDAANYVELSTDGATFAAGKLFAKIKAGEFCTVPAEPGVTYGIRANTASCDCQVIAIEA